MQANFRLRIFLRCQIMKLIIKPKFSAEKSMWYLFRNTNGNFQTFFRDLYYSHVRETCTFNYSLEDMID